MSKKRRQHSAQFKAQVGLDVLKGIDPKLRQPIAVNGPCRWRYFYELRRDELLVAAAGLPACDLPSERGNTNSRR